MNENCQKVGKVTSRVNVYCCFTALVLVHGWLAGLVAGYVE